MDHSKNDIIEFLHRSYENAGVFPKKNEDIARHIKIISRMRKMEDDAKERKMVSTNHSIKKVQPQFAR